MTDLNARREFYRFPALKNKKSLASTIGKQCLLTSYIYSSLFSQSGITYGCKGDFMFREPTVIFNGLAELVKAIIPTLIIFGIIHWTGEQVAQFMLVISVGLAFVATLITRANVVPTETANAQIQTAIQMPSSSTVEQVVKREEANR